MSDVVKVALIAAFSAALPTILGFVNNWHLKRLALATEKLVEHTNGMQKTIETLAFKDGVATEKQDAKDREKP